jgi:cation transport ATPase
MNPAEAKQTKILENAGQLKDTASTESMQHREQEHEHALNSQEISRVLVVAAAAGVVWFLHADHNLYVTVIGVIFTFLGGFPIFHEAYENIVQRRMTMELSMTIAIVAALAIREIFTALVITLFVLVAEILAGRNAARRRYPSYSRQNVLCSASLPALRSKLGMVTAATMKKGTRNTNPSTKRAPNRMPTPAY